MSTTDRITADCVDKNRYVRDAEPMRIVERMNFDAWINGIRQNNAGLLTTGRLTLKLLCGRFLAFVDRNDSIEKTASMFFTKHSFQEKLSRYGRPQRGTQCQKRR